MNLKPIIIAMAAATSQVAIAQINSPQSSGYAVRAAAMLGDRNYQGCIDQCEAALKMGDNNREQLLWLQAAAAFKGGLPDAAGRLNTFVRQFPASRHLQSARLMLATLTFYSGDFAEALSQFNAINGDSLTADEAEDLDYRTAFCLLKTGSYGAALNLFDKLSTTSRYADAATFYKAYIAYSDYRYDEALDLFRKCDTDVEPGNMAGYYVTQILFKQGKYADAANAVMPLLARNDLADEFKDEAERVAGECFYAMGDDNRAMVYLNPYIEKHLATAPLSTRYIVGVERYQMGNYESAVTLLGPVTELKDEMGQSASLTLGQSYMALGNLKSALMAFDKAANLDFDSKITEMAYYNYAVAQVDGGRMPFASSVATLEEFLKRYPDSRYADTVREYLIKGYMATDDYEGALRWLDAYRGKPTDDILNARQQVNFVLGTRALQSGNADKAIAYLQEALKYAKRNADIARQCRLWLGDAYYASGNYTEARKQYQDFLKVAQGTDVNRPLAQYNLAYSHFAERNYDEARKQFRAAESSKKLPSEVRVDCINRIADTYYYASDFATAEKTYKEAYDLNPGAGDYSLYQYALMQGYIGRFDKKLTSLEQMIADFPSSPLRPSALMEKAVTLIEQKRSGDAVETYLAVVQEYPSTSQGRSALLQLAILNNADGKTDSAVDFYKRLITESPSSAESALAVQDLKRIYAEQGNIEELNTFLENTEGAPQLDAVERNAIAAASLLRKACSDAPDAERLAAALELIEKYPDAEGSEDALFVAAQIEYNRGEADKALEHFTELSKRASTSAMRHNARMGVIRSARDMGETDVILSVSEELLGSSAGAGNDVPEVKFIRAGAFAAADNDAAALPIWKELAKTPANIYGTRSAFELADHYFRAGDYEKALDAADALIDANPPHPYWIARTYILYSDILRAQSPEDTFEADEYLRVLRSNYPGTENDIFMMIEKRLPKQ